MAVIVNPLDSRLQIQLHIGVNEEGKDLTKTKTFSRIKSEINDQDLYDVALSIVGLQEHPAVSIRKLANAEYEEE